MTDKYSAVWVSHSSMGDFLKCPRAYYLHNIYKNPKTGRKIAIVNPALALGVAVHEVVEGLRNFPAAERFSRSLFDAYEMAWKKVSGKSGGFQSEEEEVATRERGRLMIERVIKKPGPLANKTVKFDGSGSGMLPNFFLSEEENIILCGKVDWLEYLPESDSLHVIDFKTGRHDEKDDSLQLPIYLLLLNALQKRKVSKASYWYLDRDDDLTPKNLPLLDDARSRVLEVARRVKDAREKKIFECPRKDFGGCFTCRPFEAVLAGDAEFVGVGEYNQDLYLIPDKKTADVPQFTGK